MKGFIQSRYGEEDTSAEIWRMYMDNNLQGRGHGSRLLRVMEDELIQNGVENVFLRTIAHSWVFYKRNGYCFKKELLLDINGEKFNVFEMEKSLK